MPQVVSTGQITIVDTNDARPITAYLTASKGTQQVYSKDESTVSFAPSWFTSPYQVIDAHVFMGGIGASVDITEILSNRKFCLTPGGAALTSSTASTSFVNDSNGGVSTPFAVTINASTTQLTISANLKDSVTNFQVFFEGDYTDPATNLTTHVIASVTLNTVKTGTNAVYINIRGKNIIEEATGSTKNATAIAADLIRAGGTDTTNLTYAWWYSNGATQITAASTSFGFKSTGAGSVPSALPSDLNNGIPGTSNTIIISESAIVDQDVFKVEITDGDGKKYVNFFTVYDVSDPYELRVTSSSGDKLQNGQGTTALTPTVYYGASQVTPLTGWSFSWTFYDKTGKRAAFVDTAKISIAGGGTISSHSNAAAMQIFSTSITGQFAAGDIIKCVTKAGEASYFEVASSTSGSVTIKTTNLINTWLSWTAPLNTTTFVDGKIFGCIGTRITAAGDSLTVSGDDIDVKGTIQVSATRP